VARAALVLALANLTVVGDERGGPIRTLLEQLGPGDDNPHVAGMVRLLLAREDDAGPVPEHLERLAADPDPHTACTALQWLSHWHENAGDPVTALGHAERALALVHPGDGPWRGAMLHAQLSALAAHLGDRRRAAEHARTALPVMARLGATDDEAQLRSLLALCAIADGRLDEAEAGLGQIDRVADGATVGGTAVHHIGLAELALARGDVRAGLAAYQEAVERVRELRFPGIEPTGLEPWVLAGEASAVVAFAHHASAADEAAGRALFAACRERGLRYLREAGAQIDVPVAGVVLFAVGAWALVREAGPAGDAVALLALAERFAYNRAVPTLAWERIVPHAEAAAPGELAARRATYADRAPHDLLGEARGVLERVG
jgi:tetratricopeptide (TPR) repeat protein